MENNLQTRFHRKEVMLVEELVEYMIKNEKWFKDLEAELREYIGFIDRVKRIRSFSIEMKIKYEIYKEFLNE